ncbi:MAG: GNAT family N-acetyltransferase [Clostridiales bacterium]|nr:GNAT family N-acetyltransferase [Clostridiales bacterium]
MNVLERAKIEDAELCRRILDDGRDFQRQQGFYQWADDYPNLSTVLEDIDKQRGYVLKIDGVIVGYMCIDFAGEPTYATIEGKWNYSGAYAVVHRLAFVKEHLGKGLADVTFNLIQKLCIANGVPYIRVDTGFYNQRMQHILTKNGFSKCGIITLLDKTKRFAYDKLIKL